MMNINKIIKNQFAMVKANPNATRSPKITLELHSSIKKYCQEQLGSDYEVICQDTKEFVYSGPFLDKKVDIAILKDKKLVGAIEVKVIRSSYKKNATNYFYNMLGETANFKEGGVKICQLIVIPEVVEFKDRGVVKQETINDTQIQKYVKLENSATDAKPDTTIVNMVKMNYETGECFEPTFENFENSEVVEYLKSCSNVNTKITEFLSKIK